MLNSYSSNILDKNMGLHWNDCPVEDNMETLDSEMKIWP